MNEDRSLLQSSLRWNEVDVFPSDHPRIAEEDLLETNHLHSEGSIHFLSTGAGHWIPRPHSLRWRKRPPKGKPIQSMNE